MKFNNWGPILQLVSLFVIISFGLFVFSFFAEKRKFASRFLGEDIIHIAFGDIDLSEYL